MGSLNPLTFLFLFWDDSGFIYLLMSLGDWDRAVGAMPSGFGVFRLHGGGYGFSVGCLRGHSGLPIQIANLGDANA